MIKIILLYLRRLHLMRPILRVLAVIITISMFVTFAVAVPNLAAKNINKIRVKAFHKRTISCAIQARRKKLYRQYCGKHVAAPMWQSRATGFIILMV